LLSLVSVSNNLVLRPLANSDNELGPLKMPIRQKISLLFVVSLGSLVIVATFIRLQKGLTLSPSSDISCRSLEMLLTPKIDCSLHLLGNGYDITTWTSVEINVALFCSCAPTIRPLVRQVFPHLMASISGTSSYGSQSNPYGQSAQRSQRIRGNGIELQSETNIREKKSFYSRKKILADDDSERGVLGKNNSSEIMKTVDFVVTDDQANRDIGRENGVHKFEHV
jgi:hypothetical protein